MIIERIVQFVDYKGISKRNFYKETGLSNGFLDKNKDVRSGAVVKILQVYPEVNPLWLLLGQKPMLVERLPSTVQKIISGDNNITQVGSDNNAEYRPAVQENSVSYERTTTGVSKLEQQVVVLKTENRHLKELLKGKEEIIKNKDELLKSKEDIISLLSKEK